MAERTIVAYIYDAASGLFSRTVVSDDYRDADALRAVHCRENERALVTELNGALTHNARGQLIPARSDDEVQDLIARESGVVPPAKKTYALVANGRVFDVVETRRHDDRRLSFHDNLARAQALSEAEIAGAQQRKAELESRPTTPEERVELAEVASLLEQARRYGKVADPAEVFERAGDALRLGRAPAGFEVYECPAASVGDKIEGTTHSKLLPPVSEELMNPPVDV